MYRLSIAKSKTEGMTDFYITLVSNAQAGSTISNFKTNLPSSLHFNSAYEVALSSIIYPSSHDLISNNTEPDGGYENEFLVWFEKHEIRCRVTNCSFSSPMELIQILNQTFSNALNLFTNGTNTKQNVFAYDSLFKRVSLNRTPEITRVQLSDRLSYFLGLAKVTTHFPAFGQYSVFSGSDLMYIYSDELVEPQIISHMKVPILKVISIGTSDSGNVEKSYSNPLYVPVRSRSIDQIGIQIKNDRDHFIPFNFGKVVIVLHFRPIQISLDG